MKRTFILLSALLIAACGRSGRVETGASRTTEFAGIRIAGTNALPASANLSNCTLFGTEKGLYYWDGGNTVVRLHSGSGVDKILVLPYGLVCSSPEGILRSANLKRFEICNSGLVMKTIKHVTNGGVWFENVPQDLNDLESDPADPDNLAACTRSGVLVSTNRGSNWEFIRTPSWSSGVKCTAIYTLSGRPYVLLGHPFGGIYRLDYSKKVKNWEKFGQGLYRYEDVFEEISDIKAVTNGNSVDLYAANNFSVHIQKCSRADGKWKEIYRSAADFDLADSLHISDGTAQFVSLAGVRDWDMKNPTNSFVDPVLTKLVLKLHALTGEQVECLTVISNGRVRDELSELWTLNPSAQNRYASAASGKQGVYLQAGYADNPVFMDKLYTLMSNTGLNMITIDMKDDTGNLRFKPQSEELIRMGTSHYPVDIDRLIREAKARKIYLVARIVLFKDMRMYQYDGGKYAVKDGVTGKPWLGTRMQDGQLQNMSEYWVDPYSEEIWEYNVAVCKELIRRGFDEIQFDYIRFPTDGVNIDRADFTHRDPGMDKESAVMSFLSYARENIGAPISVDIYGSNGWHRMGGVTGQDVEMLSKYVDVICPMYYPSHFSQGFLSYEPADLRPYRIYYFGSLRNYYIARQKVVVRPWVQAFKIGVSYDRHYYGTEYVRSEIRGVFDSLNLGYTYWNSASDYSIVGKTFLSN